MKLARCIALIACLAASPSLLGQGTISLSQQDLDAAQSYFGNGMDNKSLYQEPIAFPDGARGYKRYTMWSPPSDYSMTGNPSVDSVNLIRYEYCFAPLIVLAQDTAERTVLSPNQKAVFTATQFRIERVLKDVGSHRVGDVVTFIHLGGIYKDANGTLLRVTVQGEEHPYKKNGVYLLTLYKAHGDYPSDAYFSWAVHHTEVINGHIYPTPRLSDDSRTPNPAHYGESFDAYWKRLTNFLAKVPCKSNMHPE